MPFGLQQLTKKYGSEVAENLTNSHEGIGIAESAEVDFNLDFEGDLKLADDTVDFLNNEIGRNITEENGNLSPLEIAKKNFRGFLYRRFICSK